MDKLEELIHNDLQQYLLSVNEIDERLPECPDVEGKWETIANAYIPDGVREFQNYPLASLGWMMYIGMALAKMWNDDWQYYAAKDDLCVYLRDKRGYDAMDEYIRRDVLKLKGKDFAMTEELVSECASRVHNTLMHQDIEPGSHPRLPHTILPNQNLAYPLVIQFQILCLSHYMSQPRLFSHL